MRNKNSKIIRGLKILKHWTSNGFKNATISDLLNKFFKKGYISRAKEFIREIREDDKYYLFFLVGFDTPFFYPKGMPLEFFYQTLVEMFDPFDWHYYEISETKVSANDTVIDCGAAEGLFAYLVQAKCRKVYVVEPLPTFVDAMRQSFIDLNNIEILEFALSNKEENGFILNASTQSSLTRSSINSLPITITTIDALFFNREQEINYIKADIEGHEIEMLEGAYRTIKRDNPKIAITTYHDKTHEERISSFLKKINPRYNIKTKGVEATWGKPVMLHAWVDKI